MLIREFRRDDFEELWRIDQECFVHGISYTRAELAAYMRHRGAFTLVAEQPADGGKPQIIGFVVAQAIRGRAGHIITIDVRPHAQRGGVGSKLMAETEARLRAAGCRTVDLETAVDNMAAITFYKRHGFSVLGVIPRYYLNSVDALVLGKQLVSVSKTKTAQDSEGAEERN